MTLREKVARAMWEVRRREIKMLTQRQDQGDVTPWAFIDIGDYDAYNNSESVLSEADAAIAIIREECAKVVWPIYPPGFDHDDESTEVAAAKDALACNIEERIRQMGKP